MAPAMVSASTGAMNSVLAMLTTLMGDEYKILRAVRRDFIFLKGELASMKGFMETLADTEDLDPLVKGWMKQVREMTYDMEDQLAKYMHMFSCDPVNRPARIFRGYFLQTKMLRARLKIAQEIQELKGRIMEASNRRQRYKLDDAVTLGNQMKLGSPSASMANRESRLPVLYAKAEEGLVGIDGPRDEIVEWLTADGQQQLKVVSIVGMGGLGKTTLAMEVYRRLEGRFDCRAVVSMSQRPDLWKILRSIFSQVSARSYASIEVSDERQLFDELREFLNDKRYFIIIDDIWNSSTWRMIKCALLENVRGSRILVTTRNTSVARSCCYEECHIFHMAPLSYEESRKLFLRRIFRSYHCPPHLEEVCDEILGKCDGLPLSIITIASLLASKLARTEEWKRVRHSIFSVLDKTATGEGMMGILNLSYVDLPFHLRTCLLYLSIFPEDYVIDRVRLLRRWMAEGFITVEHGKSSDEAGDLYFNELIDRNLIQPVDIRYDGRVYACKVHDIILEFIMSKSVEENFVTYGNHDHMFGLRDKVRRLSLDCRDGGHTYIPSETTTSHVRSLTIIGSNEQMPALANFRALRVLDVECSGELENSYLQNIGRLYLLRYLRIQTTTTIALPEQIGKLQFLETLDLSGTHIMKLPSSIVRLKQLIYLLVNNVKLTDGIGELEALQELSDVEVDSSHSASSLQELGSLTALRVLGLKWSISDIAADKNSYADNLVSSLNKVSSSNLQSLYVESAKGCSLDFLLDSWSVPSYCLKEFRMKTDYHFSRIPKWVSSLINLTFLAINIDPVQEEVLQILGILPALLVMLLSSKSSSPEQRQLIRSNGFQLLRQFGFICRNSWPMLMFEQGAMPRLEKLQMEFRAQGECVPNGFHFGIEHLTSLKHLVVEINCTDARFSEVEAAEYAIKSAASAHLNHPRLELQRQAEKHMVVNKREISVHGAEEAGQNEGDDVVEIHESFTMPDYTGAEAVGKNEGDDIVEIHESFTMPDYTGAEAAGKNEGGDIVEIHESFTMPDYTGAEEAGKNEGDDVGEIHESFAMPDPVTIATAVGWGISAVGWVVSPIISKLLNKGFSYLGFHRSKKLKELETKVLQLKLMLEAVEESPHRDLLEKWIKELRYVFYEAEDILDDVEYYHLERQILSQLDHGMTPRRSNWKLQSALPESSGLKKQASGTTSDDAHLDMSKRELKKSLEKIEKIINEAHQMLPLLNLPSHTNAKKGQQKIINEAHQMLPLLNLPSHTNAKKGQTAATNSRGPVTTAAPPPKVFGRDEDRDTIIALLHEAEGDGQPISNSGLCYSIIGIHGIPGSGKSTLAQLVCDHEKKDKQEKKRGHFDLVMWVHVSQNFSVDTIFRDMFEEVTGKSCPQFSSRYTLQGNLKEELYGKRFLLVLDDVWYNKVVLRQLELQQILSPLRVGGAGSKILVTSRTADALIDLHAVRYIPISDLDEGVFLNLFMHYALGFAMVHDKDRRKFETIGEDIAKKLKRSPLAARTVGGQLRIRPKVEFWRSVCYRDLLNETMDALWWSYQHFDEQVRRCFAYCSIFPRRHRLERDELVNLWVAEGFIKTTETGEKMEDIARSYFDELVSTSFLLGRKSYGGADYYIVHDLLHDLAEKVAGSDCFRIENGWTGKVPRDVRHLFVMTCNRELSTMKIPKLKKLRTLIIDDDAMKEAIEDKCFESMFTGLRKLRTLKVRIRMVHGQFEVPASIGQLKHIRYLTIRTRHSEKLILPSTFSKLYHMQVLDFGFCSELGGQDLGSLVNLRHILTLGQLDLPNITRLISLQTLPVFVARKEEGYELRQLKHLNKLRGRLEIRGLQNVGNKEEALEANLAGKKHLTHLILGWYCQADLQAEILRSCSADLQAEILEGLCPPMHLETLEIRNYEGSRYPCWMVGNKNGPKHLQRLVLDKCSRLGAIPGRNKFFVHLPELILDGCSWDSLPENMEHLTSLKILRISGCMNIQSLPTLPRSLEEFGLSGCSHVFVRSCQTIGDPNWQKIQHIPNKYFGD